MNWLEVRIEVFCVLFLTTELNYRKSINSILSQYKIIKKDKAQDTKLELAPLCFHL